MVYVVILLVPIMFIVLAVLELAFINFEAGSNVIAGQQLQYNTEAGINLALKRLQLHNFDPSFKDYNLNNIYILDDAESFTASKNCFQSTISKSGLGYDWDYTITSRGKYRNTERSLTKVIKRDGLQNLGRRFSANRLYVSNGKLKFQIPSSRVGNQSRFLITGTNGVCDNSSVYTYSSGGGPGIASRALFDDVFYIYPGGQSIPGDVTAGEGCRNRWVSYSPRLWYFVTSPNADIVIDREALGASPDVFLDGFINNGGKYLQDIFNCSQIRVILIDGDITLKNFLGDDHSGKTTLAQRYFTNLVIYCTGRLTIENCDLRGYGDKIWPDSDVNFSFHSREIDFKAGISGETLASCLGRNEGLIRENEGDIIEVIKMNTTRYSDWTSGY